MARVGFLAAFRVAIAIGRLAVQLVVGLVMTVIGFGSAVHMLAVALSSEANRQDPGAAIAISVRENALITTGFALYLGAMGLILLVACWREYLPVVKKAEDYRP